MLGACPDSGDLRYRIEDPLRRLSMRVGVKCVCANARKIALKNNENNIENQ
jgi:hypothetical protein